MKKLLKESRIFEEQIKYYRISLLIVAVSFPFIGFLTNFFDKEVYDPLYLRVILGIMTLCIFIGSFDKKFRKHFHLYFNFLLLTIVIWTGLLTFKNNFSYSYTFFYITAIAIVSFALNHYKNVAIFSIVSLVFTVIFLFFSDLQALNRLTIIVSVIFIQIVAFIVVRTKNLSEQKFIENEIKYRKLFEAANDAIIIAEANTGVITEINSKAVELVAFGKNQMIGKPQTILHPHEDIEKINQIFNEGIKGNLPIIEFSIQNANQEIIPVEISTNTFIINEKQYVIGIFRDITERKKAENILRKNEIELKKSNADKDRFMQILAHDLKQPFNSLLGFSDLLVKNVYSYKIEKIEKQLTIINQIAHKTFHLLEDLLLWSKSQSGKLSFIPQQINLQEICKEQIEHVKNHADTKNIAIQYIDSECTEIIADANMLKTILRNLISNAIKFTNTKGQVTIFVEKNHENAIITVSDTGIGITEQNIPKLFNITEHFSTDGTDGEKGTGLGLKLCKEFVEKHNGKIWVESKVGKGSDFKFTLPLEKRNN